MSVATRAIRPYAQCARVAQCVLNRPSISTVARFYSSSLSPDGAIARSSIKLGDRSQSVKFFSREYTVLSSDKPAVLYTYEDVKKLSQTEHPDVVLIDVREPDEFAAGHIPTAVNVPFKSSPGALGLDEESFKDAFGFDKPPLDKKLVFYCLAGLRSTPAEQLAATFGYQE